MLFSRSNRNKSLRRLRIADNAANQHKLKAFVRLALGAPSAGIDYPPCSRPETTAKLRE